MRGVQGFGGGQIIDFFNTQGQISEIWPYV